MVRGDRGRAVIGTDTQVIVDVVEEATTDLREYSQIPIAFEVREVVDVVETPHGRNRFSLTLRAIDSPYEKDYDVLAPPAAWPSQFDLSHWRFFAARVGGERVGGAAVVLRAPDVQMLQGRADVAILWDIRVAKNARRHGVGAALMENVEAWSVAHGARWLEVETQNINVPACRFYEQIGFELREVNRSAYVTLPGEIQLIWGEKLDG